MRCLGLSRAQLHHMRHTLLPAPKSPGGHPPSDSPSAAGYLRDLGVTVLALSPIFLNSRLESRDGTPHGHLVVG